MSKTNRPTRSQHQLLEFISAFVKEYGYGPSYREIMRSLDYKSVSTVAIHVDGLVAKGLLRKHRRSARSLEVVKAPATTDKTQVNRHELWLYEKLQQYLANNTAELHQLREWKRLFHVLNLPQLEKAVIAELKRFEDEPE